MASVGLTKIRAKITIIVIENREPIILLLFVNVKKSRYPYFLIRCWLQLLRTDERSSYYKVYDSVRILFHECYSKWIYEKYEVTFGTPLILKPIVLLNMV